MLKIPSIYFVPRNIVLGRVADVPLARKWTHQRTAMTSVRVYWLFHTTWPAWRGDNIAYTNHRYIIYLSIYFFLYFALVTSPLQSVPPFFPLNIPWGCSKNEPSLLSQILPLRWKMQHFGASSSISLVLFSSVGWWNISTGNGGELQTLNCLQKQTRIRIVKEVMRIFGFGSPPSKLLWDNAFTVDTQLELCSCPLEPRFMKRCQQKEKP